MLSNYRLIHSGKVRDIYHVDDNHLLLVVSDRVSAFDVVLPNTIPNKGVYLNQISNFWFENTQDIIPNHLQLSTVRLEDLRLKDYEYEYVKDRAVVARKLTPVPFEAIVRGYVVGSLWKVYKQENRFMEHVFHKDLVKCGKLDSPIFTPTTKDKNDKPVTFFQMSIATGEELAEKIKVVSLLLYCLGNAMAEELGYIIADTKFEFGLDDMGELVLMDEVLTPDSSRYWKADEWESGVEPDSFDKQIIRNYLEYIGWNKQPPPPILPDEIVEKTADRYKELWENLCGKKTS